MFKWFRKYNKYLLVVGMSLLMIAFLIQGTISSMMPDASNEPVGTIDGEEVTLGEQRHAAIQLQLLRGVSPLLAQSGGEDESALRWLLMLRDARRMGLSASQFEAQELAVSLGQSDETILQLARQMNVPSHAVWDALGEAAVVNKYRELVMGLAHRSANERMDLYQRADQYVRIGFVPAAIMLIEAANGSPRLSEPLVQRFVHDQQATVSIVALPISASRYADKVTAVDQEQVQKLYEEHKSALQGTSEPYGFGYRFPNRVKLEYLTIPAYRLRAKVQVEEADLLSYYDQHPDEFRAAAGSTANPLDKNPGVRPYEEVRERIIDRLRNERAAGLGKQMIRDARGILMDDARSLKPGADGYREIPSGPGAWQPMPLRVLAEELQKKYGVLPDVERREDQWLTQTDLANLPGIGQSTLDRRGSFPEYVMSAKELAPAATNPLIAQRLQAQIPSQVLTGYDGSAYLFRLTQAQPERDPANLDEVRTQVEHDARLLQAYQLLLKDKQQWLDKVKAGSFASLAKEVGGEVLNPQPFSQRIPSMQGMLEVPTISGIGQNRQFVDEVFRQVREIAPQGSLRGITPAQRTFATAVDKQMSLVLAEISTYTPLTRSEFVKMLGEMDVPLWLTQALLPHDEENDPLSMKAISKRVGFVPARGGDEKEGESETTPTTQPVAAGA